MSQTPRSRARKAPSEPEAREGRFARLVGPLRPFLAQAGEPGPYPRWLTAGIKAAVAIGVLAGLSQIGAERQGREQMARLAQKASSEPIRGSAARR